MKEKLIETVHLDNNYVLEFFDASSKLVGERYVVSLISRIEIPVKKALASGESGYPDVADILDELGETVLYEQKEERIFVDEKEKDALLKQLCDKVKDNILHYYRHPDFVKKFVLKKYEEEIKKKGII